MGLNMHYCPNCQNLVGLGAPICPYCQFDLSLVPASAVQPQYAQPPMMAPQPPQPQPQVQPYGVYQQPAPQPQYYQPVQTIPPQPQPQPYVQPSTAPATAKAGVSGKVVIAAIVVVVIVIVAVLAAAMLLAPSGKKNGDGDPGGDGGGGTTPPKDTTPPTIISVIPVNGAVNVDPMPVFTIVWSEPMYQSTGTEGAFNLDPYDEHGFCGADSSAWLTNTTLQVTSTYSLGALIGGVTYTASIRWPNLNELKDIAGNYAVSSLPDYIVYEWIFTVKKTSSGDTTPPRIISTRPADGATGVGSTPSFTIVWSEPMYQSTDTKGAFNLEPYEEHGFCGADSSDWTSSTTVVITSTYTYGELNSGVVYNASIRWPNLYELKDLAGNYAESDDVNFIVYDWEFTV